MLIFRDLTWLKCVVMPKLVNFFEDWLRSTAAEVFTFWVWSMSSFLLTDPFAKLFRNQIRQRWFVRFFVCLLVFRSKHLLLLFLSSLFWRKHRMSPFHWDWSWQADKHWDCFFIFRVPLQPNKSKLPNIQWVVVKLDAWDLLIDLTLGA